MTFSVDTNLNRTPALSPDEGWQYHPSTLTGTFIHEGNRRIWRTEATKTFMRRSTVCHRDPVAVALVIDALLRMEHTHALSANTLATFLNTNYHQFIWPPVVVGRIMGDLVEAALVPGLGPDNLPIAVLRYNGINLYAINTTPIAWQWLNHIRHQIGTLAEEAIKTDGEGPNGTDRKREKAFWPDFPYNLAELPK